MKPTLCQIDEIVARAPSLTDFLNNADLVEEYFQAAINYYGKEHFNRPDFLKTTEQLREISVKIPEIADRLWQTRNTNWDFSVNCERCLGKGLNPFAWEQFFSKWCADLKSRIDPNVAKMSKDEFTSYALLTLNALADEIEEFRQRLAADPSDPLEKFRASRRFFRAIRNRPSVRSFAAACVSFFLDQPRQVNIFNCGDANVILSIFRNWYQYPRLAVLSALRSAIQPIAIAVRDCLPRISELKKREDIFFARTEANKHQRSYVSHNLKSSQYFFEALPRQIHGVWRGIAVDDCLAHDNEWGLVTPLRWGTSVLEGAQTIHIRNENGFYGSVYVTPISNGNQTWGLVEFWSPLLAQRPVISKLEQADIDETETKSFLEILWGEINLRRPKHWQGLCLDLGTHFDNYSITTYIGHNPDIQTRSIGWARSFKHADPLAATLGTIEKPRGKALIFEPGLITSLSDLAEYSPKQIFTLKFQNSSRDC